MDQVNKILQLKNIGVFNIDTHSYNKEKLPKKSCAIIERIS